MDKRSEGLLLEIKKQVKYPTGGDQFAKNFFEAFLQYAKKNPTLLNEISKIQALRNKQKHFLTNTHMVYLLLHIINFIMIFYENRRSYPYDGDLSLQTVNGWEILINFILTKYKKVFIKLLSTKDIQQNIYQRGVSYPFLIYQFNLQSKLLKVADLGCSANMIWAFLDSKADFQPLIDSTIWIEQKGLIDFYSERKIKIGEMHGLDQKYPLLDEERKNWLIACRHPQEVKPELIRQTKEHINKYIDVPHMKIIEGNILKTPFKKYYYDIVTINNTLYQLPDRERKIALTNALDLLNLHDGLLILQDNCRIKSNRGKRTILFTNNRQYFTYRTIIGGPLVEKKLGQKWLEIVKYKTTRCLEVKPGKHFEEFMKVTS